MASEKLQIVPLGGLGEFGMNCLALRYEDDIIVKYRDEKTDLSTALEDLLR